MWWRWREKHFSGVGLRGRGAVDVGEVEDAVGMTDFGWEVRGGDALTSGMDRLTRATSGSSPVSLQQARKRWWCILAFYILNGCDVFAECDSCCQPEWGRSRTAEMVDTHQVLPVTYMTGKWSEHYCFFFFFNFHLTSMDPKPQPLLFVFWDYIWTLDRPSKKLLDSKKQAIIMLLKTYTHQLLMFSSLNP